jgi:hypothetical protein
MSAQQTAANPKPTPPVGASGNTDSKTTLNVNRGNASAGGAVPASAPTETRKGGDAFNSSPPTNAINAPFFPPIFAGASPSVIPQSFPANRQYILPTPISFPSGAPPSLPQPLAPTYVSAVSAQTFPGFYPPMVFGPGYNPAYNLGQPLLILSPQQQQEAQQRQQFYDQLRSVAQSPAAKVVPAAQQRLRDYSFSGDTYLLDIWRDRGQKPAIEVRQQRGPGFYSVDELQLIPLQRVSAAAAAAQGVPAKEGSIIAVTVNGTPAPPNTLANTSGPQGSQTAIQFRFQDVPRIRLGTDQDNYLAGIAVSYNLLSGLLPLDSALEDACRTFDIDEDTIAVTETQLETLLYNVTEKQQSNVRPMLFTFPLHDRYMSIALRVFIYGEIITDPRTGFKKALTTLSPWSWRHALPTGDNAFRLRGETPSGEDLALRKRYHAFLVRLYSMMWRSLTRLRIEQTALYTSDYARFAETTLQTLKPGSESTAVLEARIRALAARMQLLHGVMFNTAQFYQNADDFKNIMHPLILNLLGKYLYMRVVAS